MARTTGANDVDRIVTKLFEAEHRRIEKRVETLDRQNREMKGISDRWGFIHAGVVYVPKNSPYKRDSGSYPSLHFALCKEANDFLKDVDKVTTDQQMITQMANLLIKPCNGNAEVRNALPDSLVSLAPWLNDLPRTKEEAYTIRHDERAMRQYQKLLDSIDFYVATRMIY